MNLIQKEMLLKAARLGCTVEGADADSPLEVRKDGKNICTIHSDKMTFQRGEDDALLEQLIDIYHTVQEYTTAYEKAPDLKAVENYKLLSEFNGTVLAARDMGFNGFQFVTWERCYDGVTVTLGHYHADDYASAKEDFATRSGLIPSHRLFTNEDFAEIKGCVEFTLDNDESLTFESEKKLNELADKIADNLPTQTAELTQTTPQISM